LIEPHQCGGGTRFHASDPMPGNQYFLLPPQADPKDGRKRNAFGYLLGFGEAAKAYYKKKDKQAAKGKAKKQKKRKAK
jgi:hypothetical protein